MVSPSITTGRNLNLVSSPPTDKERFRVNSPKTFNSAPCLAVPTFRVEGLRSAFDNPNF